MRSEACLCGWLCLIRAEVSGVRSMAPLIYEPVPGMVARSMRRLASSCWPEMHLT